jgi:hypothetical protein
MEINDKEIANVEAIAISAQIVELDELQLALVGGGIAELVGA